MNMKIKIQSKTYIILIQVLQKFILLQCISFMHSYVMTPTNKIFTKQLPILE